MWLSYARRPMPHQIENNCTALFGLAFCSSQVAPPRFQKLGSVRRLFVSSKATNLASAVRTADVKQFASVLQPCPTTSRPRDIPAGNIRQQQTDFHLTFS